MIKRHEKMTNSKKIRIFTLGWSPEFVIRPLMEEGLSKEDVIVLIASKPETDYVAKRIDEAYKQIDNFLQIAGLRNLYYREVDINRDFMYICRDVVRIVKEFDTDNYFKFYLTGGMRVLVVAALTIARLLSLAGTPVEVKLSREDRPVSYTVPMDLLKLNVEVVTKTQLELLRQLKTQEEARFEDLAIGRSEVTVRKHLTKLRKKGLVSYTVRGRKQIYRLTLLGEILLEVLS